jgi:anti-sigma factor RsiW
MNDGTPTQRGSVPQPTAHLTEATVEALADGLLAGQELLRVEAHVEECSSCAAELEAARSLFQALARLPRFAPSAEFADLVMANIQVTPRASPLFAWIRHWTPETRRGWSLLVASLLAPMLPLLGFALWVGSNPAVSATAVLQWSYGQGRALAIDGATAVASWGGRVGIGDWIAAVYNAASGVPLDAIILALVILAVAIPLSAWSLVRLVRTPTGNVTYAN